MFSPTIQHTLRLAAGVGMLLLVGIQQRAADEEFAKRLAAAAERRDSRAPEDSDEPRPEPLTIANTLPDAVPPRWLGDHRVDVEQAPDHIAVRAWDSAPARGSAPSPGEASTDVVGGWVVLPHHARPESAPIGPRTGLVAGASAWRAAAIGCCIVPVGPPRL